MKRERKKKMNLPRNLEILEIILASRSSYIT